MTDEQLARALPGMSTEQRAEHINSLMSKVLFHLILCNWFVDVVCVDVLRWLMRLLGSHKFDDEHGGRAHLQGGR